MKQRKRTNRTETRTNGRQTAQNLAANHAANGAMTGEVAAVPVAEAARLLGVDARTVRRLCDNARLHSFLTPGGHRRVSLADIERIQRGDTDTKRSSNGHFPSPLEQRKESVQELRLMADEKKARMALQELEDQERQRREEEEAARRAEENEARREQREREALERQQLGEQQKREEREEFQWWVDGEVEGALRSLPPDIAGRFAGEIELSVADALQGVSPDRPKPIVQGMIWRAVERVVQPWQREQQRKQDITRAVNAASDPGWVRGLLGNTQRQIRAKDQATRAILGLPESAGLDQMVAVGRAAVQRMVLEEQEQEERELAQQREQQDRQKREREIDAYLVDVLTYLMELQNAPGPRGIEFTAGEIFELFPRIKADIKPKLLQDPLLHYFTARQRVRQHVDDWIETSLNERPK
jgi:excisionase family DNA binding protein